MNRAASRFTAALLIGMWLFIAACDPQRPRENLPTLHDLRPSLSANRHGMDSTARTLYTGVHRLDLPYTANLVDAWALVNMAAVPETMSHWWHRNGLRAGVLAPDAQAAFFKALPPAYGRKQQLIIGSHKTSVLVRAAPPRRPAQVTFPVDSGPPQIMTLHKGRYQMLIRAIVLDSQRIALEIAPHHHVPQVSRFAVTPQISKGESHHTSTIHVVPRSHRAMAMAGRILYELTLSVVVPNGHLLVVGLNQPIPEEDPSSVVHIEAGTVSTAAEPIVKDSSHSKPKGMAVGPNNLGRALLGGTRVGRPIQMLLMIESPTVH